MPVPPVPPRPMPWAPRPRLPPIQPPCRMGTYPCTTPRWLPLVAPTTTTPVFVHLRAWPPAQGPHRSPPALWNFNTGDSWVPHPDPAPHHQCSCHGTRNAPPDHRQLTTSRLHVYRRTVDPRHTTWITCGRKTRTVPTVPDKNRLPISVPRHPPDTGAGASAGAGAALLPRCDLPLGPRVNRPCSSVSTCVHPPTRPALTGATAPCQPARTGTPGTLPRGDAPEPRPRSALGTAATTNTHRPPVASPTGSLSRDRFPRPGHRRAQTGARPIGPATWLAQTPHADQS
jgi:hypothetical protein